MVPKKENDLTDLLERVKVVVDRCENLEKSVKEMETTKANFITTSKRSDNSDEMRTLRLFGAKNVKDLVEMDVASPQFSRIPMEYKQQVLDLKRTLDVGRMIAVRFRGGKPDYIAENPKNDIITNLSKEYESSPFCREVLMPKLKAYTTGGNPDWLQEITASSYMSEFELERKVTPLFRDLPMPSSPYNLPVQDGTTVARIAPENTQVTDASFSSSKIQMTATKLFQHSVLPEEMDEDSAPSILPIIRDDVVQAQERAYEIAILNGQKSGAIDTVAIAADDARKAWDGLRFLGRANSAFGGDYDFSGTLDEAGLKAMKKQGGKFTINPMALTWIASSSAYHQMVGLDIFATAEKFGTQLFTNLTGILGTCLGCPVIVSEHMPENLNVVGVEDGITLTTTGLILVNRNRFFLGTRRAIRVRLQPDLPYHDRWLISSYSRKDYQGHVQDAGETSVVYGYNIVS